jgi:Protein of unknown function (DUF402)
MPPCIERKILLTGVIHEYPCDVVLYTERFGILRYVLDRQHSIGKFSLEPGDITYALYWSDRPYTLYTWRLRNSGRMLYYFNIADSISLQPDTFIWRDLVVDILIDDELSVQILDEQELPLYLEPTLRDTIERAKKHILDFYASIIREVNSILSEATTQR